MYRIEVTATVPEPATRATERNALATHLAQRVWQTAMEHMPDFAQTPEFYLAVRATIEAELNRHVESVRLARTSHCDWKMADTPCREIDALLAEIAS